MACIVEGIDISLVESDELLEQLVSHDHGGTHVDVY